MLASSRFGVLLVLLTASGFVLAGCSSNPADAGMEDFHFGISVVDTAGHPVSGLRVSIWSDMMDEWWDGGTLMYASVGRPLTRLVCLVEERSNIEVSVYDLDGARLEQLQNGVLSLGFHDFFLTAAYSPGAWSGTRVLECRLTARDTTSGSVLDRDSVYAVFFTWDPEQNAIGLTDSGGTFETDDRLHFPHLWGLPEIELTTTECESLGVLQLPDSIVIALSDTSTRGAYQHYHDSIKVTSGSNEFELVWDPQARSDAKLVAPGTDTQIPLSRGVGDSVDFSWHLYQNCPNPFN